MGPGTSLHHLEAIEEIASHKIGQKGSESELHVGRTGHRPSHHRAGIIGSIIMTAHIITDVVFPQARGDERGTQYQMMPTMFSHPYFFEKFLSSPKMFLIVRVLRDNHAFVSHMMRARDNFRASRSLNFTRIRVMSSNCRDAA